MARYLDWVAQRYLFQNKLNNELTFSQAQNTKHCHASKKTSTMTEKSRTLHPKVPIQKHHCLQLL